MRSKRYLNELVQATVHFRARVILKCALFFYKIDGERVRWKKQRIESTKWAYVENFYHIALFDTVIVFNHDCQIGAHTMVFFYFLFASFISSFSQLIDQYSTQNYRIIDDDKTNE